MKAAMEPSLAAVNRLLDAGANANVRNAKGWTALDFAHEVRDRDIGVRLLRAMEGR